MAMAITIIAAIIICSLTAWFSYRYVASAFNAIDQVLDSVLTRSTDLPFAVTEETRRSKLTHKAIRIVHMTQADVSQTTREKETIQSFISDMSHQMKTPLSGISMYSDLLLEGNASAEEGQEFLSRIKAGTDKLQWMMDSLVKMSRLEVGAIQLCPVPAGIRQTISDSISSVYGAAEQKHIAIKSSSFADVLLLHDRKWTGEVFSNILENAVKYSPAGSEIAIRVEPLSLYTSISISDSGAGIDPSEWNAVFKRFYRGKNSGGIEGAGLGLYLAALICEKQGGYIMLDSQPGQYTTFSVFLQNC